MQIPPKSPTPIAKLIIVQPLADHDGAAIFGLEILTFEKQTGVLLKRTTIFPSLEEQLDLERSIDMLVLTKVIRGETAQSYLNSAKFDANTPTGVSAIIPILSAEVFFPHSECDLFWWNATKSYPVLRAFFLQNNENVDSTLELDPVIDVRSFIGTKRIQQLDDNEQVYTVLNWIAQRFMPTQVNVPSGVPASPELSKALIALRDMP